MNACCRGERKGIMEKKSASRRKTLLGVVCVLLGLSAVSCVFDMHYVIENITNREIAYADVIVAIASLLDALFCVRLILHAYDLCKRKRPDTSNAVNRCQSLAIITAGLSIVDTITDSLADNYINTISLIVTVCTVLVIVAYYKLVQGMSHTTFWDGIRAAPQLSPYLAVGDVSTEFTLDEKTGRLRPLKPCTKLSVKVLTADEYLKQAPVQIIQQIMHSLKEVRRSSCIQLGDIVFGNVFIPMEVQEAAGYETNDDLGFSYQFVDGVLTLIMPEEEEGLERVFLAQSLVDQYLDKSTAISFIAEMIVMLVVRVSNWMTIYESRLAKLEENLNDDVYEMPTGFSEFISNARRELGAIQAFCRQTGDMLEDLTQVAKDGGYDRAASQCATISRQIARLALDAADVREFAGEIRASYQERIEVRQNNVMSMLTIVETVFTPLALVTGWYGMNFVNMPELHHPDAYFIVAAILIFLIAAEFSFFKRRRWF